MSDEIKVNRPSSQPAPRYDMPRTMPMEEQAGVPSASKLPWIILGVVVLVLILVGVMFRDRLFSSKAAAPAAPGQAATAGSSGYQAVFLTNGQVYFGKMSNPDSDYPTLTDIYYLQVVQQPPLQGQQQGGQAPAPTPTPSSSVSLVKLGNELHGPVDLMHIAKGQILFYEDMKTDSQVYKAIQAYKANPSGAAAPSPTAPSK